MEWRVIPPEAFQLKINEVDILTLALVSFEHLDSNFVPDGGRAHIYERKGCYVLCTRMTTNKLGTKNQGNYTNTVFWFSEAIEAVKTLPPPKYTPPIAKNA